MDECAIPGLRSSTTAELCYSHCRIAVAGIPSAELSKHTLVHCYSLRCLPPPMRRHVTFSDNFGSLASHLLLQGSLDRCGFLPLSGVVEKRDVRMDIQPLTPNSCSIFASSWSPIISRHSSPLHVTRHWLCLWDSLYDIIYRWKTSFPSSLARVTGPLWLFISDRRSGEKRCPHGNSTIDT